MNTNNNKKRNKNNNQNNDIINNATKGVVSPKARTKNSNKKILNTNISNKNNNKNHNNHNNKNNKYNNKNSKNKIVAKNEELKIIPLGGLKEIGKNITALECMNQILIIDCGLSFPEDDMLGIDVVIPNFSYLRDNMEKIKGLIITHGHEDHIGGVPYLLQQIDVPIYAPPLARCLIQNKLKEFRGIKPEIYDINPKDVFNLGIFNIEAVRTNHSIADAVAFYIKTPGGNVFHTGDFKIDYTPLDGKIIDLGRYAQIGKEGVDVLLSESTNIMKPGFTPSEKTVVNSMNKIFDETDSRIIIATFSSNVYRIKYFMEESIKHGRKIAISGRSMENVIAISRELNYLNIPETAFVDIRQIKGIPDNNITIITTGSQGEPMSALTRMANDMHKAVRLKKGDVVVFSSSPIPGNDRAVTDIVNKLYEKQVEVKLSDFLDIHVSGHACREEHKLIHALLKPKMFIPVHGEYRHLIEHAKLASELGMSQKKIFVMSNGDELSIRNKITKLERNKVNAEAVLVDGYGIGDISDVVLRDRKQLSESGLISVVVAIDKNNCIMISNPELTTRGFIYVKNNETLIQESIEISRQSIQKCLDRKTTDFNTLKNALRNDLRSFIYKKTKRSPMILPVVLYV